MAIDPAKPLTQLFVRMATELRGRANGINGSKRWGRDSVASSHLRPPLWLLDDYRQGDPPLRRDVHSGWSPMVREFVRMGRLNMADLVVSSTSNRMDLLAFRTAAASDSLGDSLAAEVVGEAGYPLVAKDIHDNFLTLGDAYALVTPVTGSTPAITYEDPRYAITAHDPLTRRVAAGLKLFRDEDDANDLAYVYTPDGVFTLRLPGRTSLTDRAWRFDPDRWEVLNDEAPQPVPGGEIPLVRFRNRDGKGEFEKHLDTIDRINDKIFDEWWIAKIQAFRQRGIKNLPDTREVLNDDGSVSEVPITDEEFNAALTASPDKMWRLPGDAEIWESSTVDLTPITSAIEKDRARLAASTSTMLHTITPDAASGSAEGAALLREEHLFKINDRMLRAGIGHARVMQLCFRFMGDEKRSALSKIVPMWGPIERYSLSQRAQAGSQLKGVLPTEAIWRDVLQYPPAEAQELYYMAGRGRILPDGGDVPSLTVDDPPGGSGG